MAVRSRLMTVVCIALATLAVNILKAAAFAGTTGTQNLRKTHESRALPLEHGDLMSAMTDASTVVLADDIESIPVVAFVVSIFVGIVGYSTWTAFGPGASELRDPFEEHED